MSDRALLEVGGGDRVRWLDSMLSNDVTGLQVGGENSGCYATALTAKGRIVADLHVLVRDAVFWLETAAAAVPKLIEHFERHLIADDVSLRDLGPSIDRLAVEGPLAGRLLERAAAGAMDLAADCCAELRIGGIEVVAARYGWSGEVGFQLLVPAGSGEAVAKAIEAADLVVAAVLSGNRNFEGRINPHVRANYLASPPLVVAYAIAGSMKVDLLSDPLGIGTDGQPVTLKDIWPKSREIHELVADALSPEMFRKRYTGVFDGGSEWRQIETASGTTYDWDEASTYVKHPPYFTDMGEVPGAVRNILGARPLAILGDSVTTDHISPAGAIKKDSPAGAYLIDHGVEPKDFNSYGSRRGNHEVMMRGTFANIRLRNEMAPGTVGGLTRLMPEGTGMTIYEAAMKYQAAGVPLVVVAGKEYGAGSSRDWAAKGPRLLGVKAVIVESFERIHRANLVGMGVLPLQFKDGVTRGTLGLDGGETFDITGIEEGIQPRMELSCRITRADGASEEITLVCRIDTADEVAYYLNGGILPYVLRNLMKQAA